MPCEKLTGSLAMAKNGCRARNSVSIDPHHNPMPTATMLGTMEKGATAVMKVSEIVMLVS